MECERVDDIRLDALEVQDNAGTDERNTDVGRDPRDIRPCCPTGDEKPDGEHERPRDH